MTEDHSSAAPTHAWRAGWKDNERAQLRSWLRATPAQRLHWLEEAIKLAYQAGVLRQHD